MALQLSTQNVKGRDQVKRMMVHFLPHSWTERHPEREREREMEWKRT